MIARLPIPIDGTPFMACPVASHRRAFRAKDGCPECAESKRATGLPRVVVNPALPPDVIEFRDEGRVVGAIVNVKSPKPRPGKLAEDALCAALEPHGILEAIPGYVGGGPRYIRQYSWAVAQGRDWRADLAFLEERVLVEVVGGAHAAGRKRVFRDVERSAAACVLGWRVLPVTPEQVSTGAAVALVRQALGDN